jgi:hypothetical protein
MLEINNNPMGEQSGHTDAELKTQKVEEKLCDESQPKM